MTNKVPYAIIAAKALAKLKGMTMHELAARAEISREAMDLYTRGNQLAISDGGFERLFGTLGVVAEGQTARLSSKHVHFMSMDIHRGNKHQAIHCYKTIAPLIGAAVGLKIFETSKRSIFLVYNGSCKVILTVNRRLFTKIEMQELSITPGEFKGAEAVHQIPAYYFGLIEDRRLNCNQFELILSGDFACESTDAVRTIAFEYGYSMTDIVNWMVAEGRPSSSRGMEDKNPLGQEFGGNVVRLTSLHLQRPADELSEEKAA